MPLVIGHTDIQAQLLRLARLTAPPQSILLAGPRHVGKRLVAEWFAQTLIAAPSQAMEGGSMDLFLLEPERVSGDKQTKERPIPIEAIRTLRHFLSRSPSVGLRRVAIIDEADQLSDGAANALLKVLEEPPAQSAIILITAKPGQLLPTIRSRVFPVYFRPVSAASLKSALPTAVDLPGFFFDLGLPGVLMSALTDPKHFEKEKETLRQLFQLSKLSLRSRLTLAETLAQNETRVRDLLEIWTVGLTFQARAKQGAEARGYYQLLEAVLLTLKQLSRSEGTTRGGLEKLLMRFP